jgi:hypothetical protein
MKKIYFLSVVIALALVGLRVNGQVNILKGGNMETADASSWDTCRLESTPTASAEYGFGYTTAIPTDGTNGCLHFSATNTGAGNSQIMFFQQVTMKKERHYVLDFAVKTIVPLFDAWFEIYLGDSIPTRGADYQAGVAKGAIEIGGFKYDGWQSECLPANGGPGDSFDGMYSAIGCIPGVTNITYDTLGTGTIKKYLGIKCGTNQPNNPFEYVVDNVTFTDMDSTTTGVSQINAISVNVFPNPASTSVTIDGNSAYTQAIVLNMLGQEMFTVKDFGRTIDVRSLKTGVYFIKLTDNNNNLAVSKFQKL